MAREGYSWSNINPRDLVESLSFRGLKNAEHAAGSLSHRT